jgi:hypothetical protein
MQTIANEVTINGEAVRRRFDKGLIAVIHNEDMTGFAPWGAKLACRGNTRRYGKDEQHDR